jgi:hypothetical protein
MERAKDDADLERLLLGEVERHFKMLTLGLHRLQRVIRDMANIVISVVPHHLAVDNFTGDLTGHVRYTLSM